MNWDEFRSRVKKVAEKTAAEINYSTDLTTLQVKLSLAEGRLEKAYTALGKTAYGHFTGEENAAEAVAEAMLRVEEEKKVVADWKRCIAALKKKHAETASEAPKEEREEPVETPIQEPSEQE